MDADELSPRAELILAWAAEAVIKQLPEREAVLRLLQVADGDQAALRSAWRFARGEMRTNSARAIQVDEMLFGADTRLDDPAGGRRAMDHLLAAVASVIDQDDA